MPFQVEMLVNDDIIRGKAAMNQNVRGIIKLWQPVTPQKTPMLEAFRHCPAA